MDHGRMEAIMIKVFCQSLSAVLRPRENQAAAGLLAKKTPQQILVFGDGDLERLKLHIFRGLKNRTQLYTRGIAGEVFHQVYHRGFESSREAQGLALFREDRGDSANRGQKAHV